MVTTKTVSELAEDVNQAATAIATRFALWLAKPETQTTLEQVASKLQAIRESYERTVDALSQKHSATVADEKSRLTFAAARAPNGLHKSDVPGLISIEAPDSLIAQAERGGRARPRIPKYQTPVERFFDRLVAFERLVREDTSVDAAQRRRDFEVVPNRDLHVHALVCGELERARASGLRGEDARTQAFNRTASALRRHAERGMKGLSPTSVMHTYRRVGHLADQDGPDATLPPITAEDFEAWMDCGRLPAWTKR